MQKRLFGWHGSFYMLFCMILFTLLPSCFQPNWIYILQHWYLLPYLPYFSTFFRACMLRRMLWDLEPIAGADYSLTGLLANSRARRETYVPIMKRQRCASLEERIESVKEKKRAKMEQNSDKSMDE